MTREDVRDGAIEAARFLARGLDDKGRFRYLVDAPTNRTLPGYDWPRHAGADVFPRAGRGAHARPELSEAALRAGALPARPRDGRLRRPSLHRRPRTSSTSALPRSPSSRSSRSRARSSTRRYARRRARAGRLSARAAATRRRVHAPVRPRCATSRSTSSSSTIRARRRSRSRAPTRSLGDPRDLDAASARARAPGGPGVELLRQPLLFGRRALDLPGHGRPLGSRARAPRALDFCLRWQAYGRKLMYGAGDTAVRRRRRLRRRPRRHAAPHSRRQPVRGGHRDARRGRARAATRPRAAGRVSRLDGRCAAPSPCSCGISSVRAPRVPVRRPGLRSGAMPGSEVDWQLRIDYAQHAGSALVRLAVCRRAARCMSRCGE